MMTGVGWIRGRIGREVDPSRRQFVKLGSLIVILSTTVFGVGTAAPLGGAPAPVPGFDLTRLKELSDRALKPVQKARLGLRFYRDEMVNRTPPPPPPFTEFKTHDYVLARITRKLREAGADPATLREAWSKGNPGEIKDCLMLFLFWRGDPELKEPVLTYLQDRSRPMRLRELAAETLGDYAVKAEDPEIGTALAKLAREDVHACYRQEKGKNGEPDRMFLIYPVKRAAIDAIKKMESAGMLLESPVTAVIKQVPTEIPLPPRASEPGKR